MPLSWTVTNLLPPPGFTSTNCSEISDAINRKSALVTSLGFDNKFVALFMNNAG